MIRRLAALAVLVLVLPAAFPARGGQSATTQAMNSGKEHLRRDEYEMALKSFSRYAELKPGQSHPYDLRACTYLRMGNLDLALQDIAESQKIDSSEQTGYAAYWLKGVALLIQGDQQNANAALGAATRGSDVAARRYARAQQNADTIFGKDEAVDKSGEPYRQKLAELLLDEYVDYELFGEQKQ